MAEPIQIIDVIEHKSAYMTQIFVVIDRMPEFVYSCGEFEKLSGRGGRGRHLIANDSGFYDFLKEVPGSTDAFAGRKFTIRLDDGGTLECHGQVWDAAHPNPPEPTVQVGISTIEKLHHCYVFSGGRISKAKLEEWLASNRPSRNYRKYDPAESLEALRTRFFSNTYGLRAVGAQRARRLRRQGREIHWLDGFRFWSPAFERSKRDMLARRALDEREA
ncbi:TPA: hypothetical protein NO005_002678 [Pseudomonas aeruginosa]|nr:hypothetical protein [Pseudomonas aeruginosa]HCH7763618.1 hypothetical protein [Pseudomonas aeruginosa]HCI3516363.1 hypothetical protein [Pseudomonas aeruginosa]HCI7130582.1 hypothetical protein [Pseudomonas aeruginosa]HCJ0533479.1 hypothetical protein [Pseudomonas aeruginosa]